MSDKDEFYALLTLGEQNMKQLCTFQSTKSHFINVTWQYCIFCKMSPILPCTNNPRNFIDVTFAFVCAGALLSLLVVATL
jgi:hypothetical protein